MTNRSDTADTGQFLARAEITAAGQALLDEDLDEMGFVMNASRLWAYRPETLTALFGLMADVTSVPRFTVRERGILVTATASAIGDSYCSVAWGTRLAEAAGPGVAAGVLRGDDGALGPAEQAMAAWARKVAKNPNATSADDVQALRDVGFSEASIFAMTVFVALRIAFSAVNDALGAHPDAEYQAVAPPEILAAVTYGRPVCAGQKP
jgi:uncharacterized peroxidase-related enzyme